MAKMSLPLVPGTTQTIDFVPRVLALVSDAVLNGPRSAVIDEAENRLWTAAAVFGALARTDDRDLVTEAREAMHEVTQRHGDAVDFWPPGFGD